MLLRPSRISLLSAVAFFGALQVQAADVLSTSGFATCSAEDSDIIIHKFDVKYFKSNDSVRFNVDGESKKEQLVVAELVVTAYGNEVYRKEFDPCEQDIPFLCPSTLL